jgi:hypothetical protein
VVVDNDNKRLRLRMDFDITFMQRGFQFLAGLDISKEKMLTGTHDPPRSLSRRTDVMAVTPSCCNVFGELQGNSVPGLL